MPRLEDQPIDLYEFTEGLVTSKSGLRVGNKAFKNVQNIRYKPINGFMWRQGYTTLGNQPNAACTGLHMARFSTGTNVAFRTQGTKIEKMDSLDGTWDDITGALTLTSGTNNHTVFAMLNDIVIVANGVDDAFQINSSLTASTVGAMPGTEIPSAVYEHRGYMWYVTPDRIYFSNLNVPATISANDFIRPGGKNGGELVGGVDFQGRNYVFKRHGIYAVEFQPTAINSAGDLFPFIEIPNPVVPGVGTQSHRSIVKFTTPSTHRIPNQEIVFFVDQFGTPRLFDGQSSQSIGVNIASSRDDTIPSLSSMEKLQTSNIWAVNDPVNNLIYCFMAESGQTENNVCWILDYNVSFSWARDSYATTFNCGAMFEKTDGSFKHYFGDYSGQVYEMDSGQTDNGVAISSLARSADLFVQSPVIWTHWMQNEVRGAAGDDDQMVGIRYYQDGEDSPSLSDSILLFKDDAPQWDEVSWDDFSWAYSGLTTKTREINIHAKTMSVEFYNETSGNTAIIEGFSLFNRPKGWKQE